MRNLTKTVDFDKDVNEIIFQLDGTLVYFRT